MSENEKQIGIIHVGLGRDLGTTYYDLIFTTSRIVFAKTGRLGIWVWFLFLLAVIGALIGALIAISKRNNMQKTLLDKSIEDILNLSRDNYSVPYSELKSIRIFSKRKLEIVTTNDKKTFVFFGSKVAAVSKDQINEYIKVIKNVVPDKLIQ